MITCDKCKIMISPDTLSFQGEFMDHYILNTMHICRGCANLLKSMFEDFFRKEIPEDEPLDTEGIQIVEIRGKKYAVHDILSNVTPYNKKKEKK